MSTPESSRTSAWELVSTPSSFRVVTETRRPGGEPVDDPGRIVGSGPVESQSVLAGALLERTPVRLRASIPYIPIGHGRPTGIRLLLLCRRDVRSVTAVHVSCVTSCSRAVTPMLAAADRSSRWRAGREAEKPIVKPTGAVASTATTRIAPSPGSAWPENARPTATSASHCSLHSTAGTSDSTRWRWMRLEPPRPGVCSSSRVAEARYSGWSARGP
jgi:hypothetical protein